MTKSTTSNQSPPFPLTAPVAEWVRTMAIQRVRGAGTAVRSRPLWSNDFPSIGLGQNLVIELLPSLVLRLRNRTTNDVLMETEPVEFGPLVAQGEPLKDPERGRARTGRKAKAKTTTAPAADEASEAKPAGQPAAAGGEA